MPDPKHNLDIIKQHVCDTGGEIINQTTTHPSHDDEKPLVVHLKRALTDPEQKQHESSEQIHSAEVEAGESIEITQTFAPKQLEILPKFQFFEVKDVAVEVEDGVVAVARSNHFFVVSKRGARRWMNLMDRNAAANPGASCYTVRE